MKNKVENKQDNNKLNILTFISCYLKKLNWYGFLLLILIFMAGTASNKNVNSVSEWAILVIIFGIPFSTFFLFAGKES